MPVSALCVSNSGNLLASGQYGCNSVKSKESPIILWDFHQ